MAPQGDDGGEERGGADDDAVGAGGGHPEAGEDHTADHPKGSLGRQRQAVGPEAAVSGQHPPGHMLGVVADQREEQPHDQQPLPVKEAVEQDEAGGGGGEDQNDEGAAPERGGPPDHRPTPEPGRVAGHQPPGQFLLERDEASRPDEQDGRPERREGGVGLGPEGAGGDHQEAVDGQSHDDETDGHGQGAIRCAGQREEPAGRIGVVGAGGRGGLRDVGGCAEGGSASPRILGAARTTTAVIDDRMVRCGSPRFREGSVDREQPLTFSAPCLELQRVGGLGAAMNRFQGKNTDRPRLVARVFLGAAFPLLIVGALGSVFGASGGAQVGGPYGGAGGGAPGGGAGGGVTPGVVPAVAGAAAPQGASGTQVQAVSQPAGAESAPARVADMAVTGANTTTELLLAGALLLVGAVLVRVADGSRRLAPAGVGSFTPAASGGGARADSGHTPAQPQLMGPLDLHAERLRLDHLEARISRLRGLIEAAP